MDQERQYTHHSRGVEQKKYRLFLINEARGLLTRLMQVQPFEMSMPMVTAAAIPYPAQKGIYQLIRAGKTRLSRKVRLFIQRMKGTTYIPFEKCQAAYAVLKLQFNALLDEFEVFADVVCQRSEHNTGIWIAGLDSLADDALGAIRPFGEVPPVICYLDRGHGAAIRRARTRLAGGDENPVAVIKIPRERMVASGIGSSLVHEVGHQVSALLDLVPSIKPLLQARAEKDAVNGSAWLLLGRWISEILSDWWSVSLLGISATTGLISVVSLPRYFIFRISADDPHPFPWIRVKISLCFGRLLYPEDQWKRLERLWETMYPVKDLPAATTALIRKLESILDDFARLVAEHRPLKLNGLSLGNIVPVGKRTPERLRQQFRQWQSNPQLMVRQPPTLVFAVVGQARADNSITPFAENQLLSRMLRHWALISI
jgi:hypothetical protein